MISNCPAILLTIFLICQSSFFCLESKAARPETTAISLLSKQHFKRNRITTKRNKAPVPYYCNSTATFNVLLECGDVEANPGPVKKSPKCPSCEKTVRINQKRLVCEVCFRISHASCVNLTYLVHNSRTPQYFTCVSCLIYTLPFHSCREINCDENSILDQSTNSDVINQHVNILDEHRNHTSVAHINAQSIFSTFNEFSLMVNTYNFDVICVTETWMKDSVAQKDYIQIPGYNPVMRPREEKRPNDEEKRGGGVGIYLKENISFKERRDLSKIDPSLETLWCEVRGKNKNSAYLLGVIYQPSSDESIKPDWLEKFDRLITEI